MKYLLGMISCLLMFGCASEPKHQATKLTHGAVKSQIVKGETTQPEVISLLGSPNITSKNRAGQEVWTYSKTGSRNEKSKVGGGLGVLGGIGQVLGMGGLSGSKAVDVNSVSTFDLMITFTENDIVEDYSIVTSKF